MLPNPEDYTSTLQAQYPENDNVSTEQPTNGADWAVLPRHIVLSSSYSDRVLGKQDQVDASKGRCRLFDRPNIINAEHEIGETDPIADVFKRDCAKDNTITDSKIKMRVSKSDIPNISKQNEVAIRKKLVNTRLANNEERVDKPGIKDAAKFKSIDISRSHERAALKSDPNTK